MAKYNWEVEYYRALEADVFYHRCSFPKNPEKGWTIQRGVMDDGGVYFQIYKHDLDKSYNGRSRMTGKLWGSRTSAMLRHGHKAIVWEWNDLLELPLYVRQKLAELRESPWFELDYSHGWATLFPYDTYVVGNILTMQWLPNHVYGRNDVYDSNGLRQTAPHAEWEGA